MLDLATNFFLTEEHVAKSVNRAEACAPRLGELNPYVHCFTLSCSLVRC